MNILKINLEIQFSVNIDNEIIKEHLVKFVNKANNEFQYIDFIKDQKEKIYEGGNDENAVCFNEALVLFLDFLTEIEGEKKKSEKFIKEFCKENDFFNYVRYTIF